MSEPDDQIPAPSGRGATVISEVCYYVAAVLSPITWAWHVRRGRRTLDGSPLEG